MKKLILFGLGDFAEIAYEYFTSDSNYEVVGFSVEKPYWKEDSKFGLPVIPFDQLALELDTRAHSFFAAVTYQNMNDLRGRLAGQAKEMGFELASYVSSRSFVWRNVEIGQHCFVFEDNTLQPFAKLGDNVVLWSGNHIGHHSVLGNDNFISSHVVISGNCHIGSNIFIGVNSTIGNNVAIGSRTWISANTLVLKNVPDNSFVSSPPGLCKPLDEAVLNTKLAESKLN